MNSVAKFRIEDYLTAFLWGFYGQSDLFGESALTLVITDKGVGFDEMGAKDVQDIESPAAECLRVAAELVESRDELEAI
jgi:hypothetical protein